MSVKVLDYGAGNLRSIVNGFRRIGVKVEVAEGPEDLGNASGIILPGVGNFGDAMEKLAAFKPALADATSKGVPFLGLCLGIQVIFESSDESPGAEGLGLFKGSCKKFAGGLKVPHMGWNSIGVRKETPLLEGVADGEFFYFVHSYYAAPEDRSIVAADAKYGVKFPAVVSKGNVHATQFHPEKSGDKGLQILKNFAGMCGK